MLKPSIRYIQKAGYYPEDSRTKILSELFGTDFSSNLNLHLPLNNLEGGVYKDTSSNTNNGTPNGAFSTYSPLGPCVGTDGIDDDITVADDASYRNIFSGGGTLFFEFILNSVNEDDGLLRKGAAVQVRTVDNSGDSSSIRFIHNFTSVLGRWDISTREVVKDARNRFGIVYDNSSDANDPILYLNGNEYSISSGLTQSLGPTGSASADSGNVMTLGKNSSLLSNGFFKDLIVWNESKSSSFMKRFTSYTDLW